MTPSLRRTLPLALVTALCFAPAARAADLRLVITQAQAGDARKYQPLLAYVPRDEGRVRGVRHDAQLQVDGGAVRARGEADGMFGGSGISSRSSCGGSPSLRCGRSTRRGSTCSYAAVVIAPKGSARFDGTARYFDGKRVIFAPLASAGELFFRSLGPSSPAAALKAASHGAAIDALARGQADVAVVKNHVWESDQGKFPGLELVGADAGANPDGTFIVSKRLDPAPGEGGRRRARRPEGRRVGAGRCGPGVAQGRGVRPGHREGLRAHHRHAPARRRHEGLRALGARLVLRFRSIGARFLSVTLVLATAVLGGLGTFLASRGAANIRASLASKGEAVATLVENVGAGYVENFDFIALDRLVANVRKDPEVAFVAVHDATGKRVTREEPPADLSGLILLERPLAAADGRPLGSVSIGYRQDTIGRVLREDAAIAAASILLALVVSGAGMTFLVRGVARPIQAVVADVERIAAGDLGVRTRVDRADETGRLQTATRDMAERLGGVIGEIGAGADALTVAASELSQTAGAISRGTGEQAASHRGDDAPRSRR